MAKYRKRKSGERDTADVKARAAAIWSQFGTYHARIEDVRNTVRQRNQEQLQELEAQGITAALSSRGMAIVYQATSFAIEADARYTVKPFDNSLKEDRLTSKLEKVLSGVREALVETVGLPFTEGFWNYFEAGKCVFALCFDDSRAADGIFPWVIRSVDPAAFAYQRGNRGLIYAVEKYTQEAAVLYDELKGVYEATVKPQWDVPLFLDELADKSPTATVEVWRCYDRERETLFLSSAAADTTSRNGNGQAVWDRKHEMGRVPFVYANCVTTGSDRPEEHGFGLIWPILTQLKQESILFSKFADDADLGARPMVQYERADGQVQIEQVYPGYRTRDKKPNAPMMEFAYRFNPELVQQLMASIESDVQRFTFPNLAFGSQLISIAGVAYREALSGLRQKILQNIRPLQTCLGQLAGFMLERSEYFLTKEMAKELAPGHEDAYLNSFSISLRVPSSKGKGAEREKLTITAEDVKGHYRVDCELEPQLPSDQAERSRNFQMLLASRVPWELALREAIQPDHPEEWVEAYNEELLMQANEDYRNWKLEQMLLDRFEQDPKAGKSFMEFGMKQVIGAKLAQGQRLTAEEVKVARKLGMDVKGRLGHSGTGALGSGASGNEMMSQGRNEAMGQAGLPPEALVAALGQGPGGAPGGMGQAAGPGGGQLPPEAMMAAPVGVPGQ